MQDLAAYAPDLLRVTATLLGALGGLWAAFHRFDLLLKARIREHAASHEDVARIEGKLDLVLGHVVLKRPRARKVSD